MNDEFLMTSPFAFSLLVATDEPGAGLPYGLTALRETEASVLSAQFEAGLARVCEGCDYLQAVREWAFEPHTFH